jgi:hypothetical protein
VDVDWNWLQGVTLVVLNNLVLMVWKPWAGAYAGEKGKNLARKEDLNEILAEVRAVAVAQKETEAKISGELWERQWRLNQRRDAYAGLLIALSRLTDVHIKEVSRVVSQGGDPLQYVYNSHDALSEVHRAFTIAGIFCTPQTIQAIDGIFKIPSTADAIKEYTLTIGKASSTVLFEARRELGLQPAAP